MAYEMLWPGTPIYEPPSSGSSTQGGNDMWAQLLGMGLGAAGSFMNSSAQNKATKEQNQLQQDALQLQRERERRDTESDIFRKLAQTSYLKSGGAKGGPTTINYGGQQTTLPDFGFGARPASQEQMTAATELEKLLIERLRAPMVNPADERELTRFGTSPMARLAGVSPEQAQRLQDELRRRGAANGRGDAAGNTGNPLLRRGY